MSDDRSWLLAGGSDRERMLDMDRRLRPVRLRTFAVIAAALIVSAPWTGWWTFLPLLVAAGLFRVSDRRVEGSSRPERWMFGAWAGSVAIIAGSLALTGSSAVGMLSLLAIPVVTLSARFSIRGIVVGLAITVALAIAVAFASDAGAVLDNPPLLIAPLTVILAVAMLSVALMHSDIEHRSKALIDQLTGMLNRTALEARVSELEQQSAITGEPVGLLLCDVDNFKEINDFAGHVAGDAMLKDVAYVIRKRLRAFDLAYRLGGDEFLVLIPGADAEASAALAEELRRAVGAQAVGGGLDITMSFGAAASERGRPFDYASTLERADRALYAAKRDGGNRVGRPSDPDLTPR